MCGQELKAAETGDEYPETSTQIMIQTKTVRKIDSSVYNSTFRGKQRKQNIWRPQAGREQDRMWLVLGMQ